MRLFIAIEFDNKIINSLKQVQGSLKACGLRGRYTREENLHLTLAFIGEYDDPDKVVRVMKEVPFEAFPLEIDGMGRFGNIYWAGLKDNPSLSSYVKALRDKLKDNGIPFDKKKFSPHITLVRDGSYDKGGRLPEWMPEMKMKVKNVSLVKSEFTKSGMKYTVIGEAACVKG